MQVLNWNEYAKRYGKLPPRPRVVERALLDGAELRATFIAAGLLRPADDDRPATFVPDVPLDEAGIKGAARSIFFGECQCAPRRVRAVLAQCDARIGTALRRVAADCGVSLEAP
jgi:hypothetical protein